MVCCSSDGDGEEGERRERECVRQNFACFVVLYIVLYTA